MQTGDRAGFGEQPSATARRLPSRINLVRALWVGGLAVVGSVFGAVTAHAADTGEADQSSDGLLGSLTSAAEPVTDLSGSVVAETDKLVTDDLELSEDVLSDGELAGEVEVSEPVDPSAGGPAETVQAGESADGGSRTRERDADDEPTTRRDAATDASAERSTQAPVGEVRDRADVTESAGGETDATASTDHERRKPGLASVVGAVDQLTGLDVSDVGATAGELASGAAGDVLGAAVPAEVSSQLPVTTQSTTATPEATGSLAPVTDLENLLDLPLVEDVPLVESLIAPVDGVVAGAAPVVGDVGPPSATADRADRTGPTGRQRQEATRIAAQTPATTSHQPDTPADTVPRNAHEATGAARPAGQDGESAVTHSSPDAGTDGLDPFADPRGGMRPSLQVTPVAGLTVLHVGAPGAASSADQAGPSSHALLPEEAVLRARLFSAAAHARNVGAKPLREANDPPVSPD